MIQGFEAPNPLEVTDVKAAFTFGPLEDRPLSENTPSNQPLEVPHDDHKDYDPDTSDPPSLVSDSNASLPTSDSTTKSYSDEEIETIEGIDYEEGIRVWPIESLDANHRLLPDPIDPCEVKREAEDDPIDHKPSLTAAADMDVDDIVAALKSEYYDPDEDLLLQPHSDGSVSCFAGDSSKGIYQTQKNRQFFRPKVIFDHRYPF